MSKPVNVLAQSFQIETSPFKINKHVSSILLFDFNKFQDNLILKVGVLFCHAINRTPGHLNVM